VTVQLTQLPLADIAPGGRLERAFLRVQAPWVERGVSRWIGLARPHGVWPCVVFGALAPDQTLFGTLVAIWAPEALDRFDTLFEAACPGGHTALSRPAGGVWHFIAVTRSPQGAGLNIGRILVRRAISWVRGHGGPEVQARTLSPAVGLPELLQMVGASNDGVGVERALRGTADTQGRPMLPIMRLHLGAGGWLDAALLDSRSDDEDSGGVTLRFGYELDGGQRDARLVAYRLWLRDRQATIADGDSVPIQWDTSGSPTGWSIGDHDDERVVRVPLVRTPRGSAGH